jgi:hypothetical protein
MTHTLDYRLQNMRLATSSAACYEHVFALEHIDEAFDLLTFKVQLAAQNFVCQGLKLFANGRCPNQLLYSKMHQY